MPKVPDKVLWYQHFPKMSRNTYWFLQNFVCDLVVVCSEAAQEGGGRGSGGRGGEGVGPAGEPGEPGLDQLQLSLAQYQRRLLR